jgi:(S)-2-hydroxyglutarate dehydrogenase
VERIVNADVAVVGAGLIGLATARRLLDADPHLSVTLVEKESRVAAEQSGRNSNVLHSGVYYRPGSLRARLSTLGKRALETYAANAGIPILRAGKLVVAVDERELGRLDELYRRARANGIDGIALLGPSELREIEPSVAGIRALRVPGTSVVEFRRVAERLAEDVEGSGATVCLGEKVVSVMPDGRVQRIVTTEREIRARVVVACAGLQSDRVARAAGLRPRERIVPFRGTYRAVHAGGERLVRGLVYPVPDPALPFLGVHFTPQVDGSVWIGPNALLATSRDGSRRLLSIADTLDWLLYPGFWKLAARHARYGLAEIWRELSEEAFLRECRRYLPGLDADRLGARFFGTRAQLMSERGELLDDFVVREAPGQVHVLNAPSPAATACLAIGDLVASLARRQLGERSLN